MTTPKTGRVVGIAVRTERNGPMREVESTRARQDGGIEGDLPVEPDRGFSHTSQATRKPWLPGTRVGNALALGNQRVA